MSNDGAGRWLELSVRVDNEAVESVCEAFRRHVHGGVVVERIVESQEYDWSDEVDPATVAAVPVIVKGYVPLDADAESRRAVLDIELGHLNAIWPVPALSVATVAEQDWANAWKAHFHTHRVGRRFVIRPPWQSHEPTGDDVVIDLDPGMAFGTGLHPTTQMCLRLIEESVKTGDRVLDLGTGSGILAIGAAKLGATVFAVDVDPIAVRVARENIALNNVGQLVTVELGTLPLARPATFDVVVANIIARIIGDLAPAFAPVLVSGGTLITSGIIADRAAEVVAHLESAGWRDLRRSQQGDWISLAGTRPL